MDSRRRLLALLGLVVAAAGVALAVAPFRVSIDLGPEGQVRARCRPPAISAWKGGEKDELRLWAVTVETDMAGYEVRGGQEPWCAEKARPRLAVAAAVIVGGLALFASQLLTRRPREAEAREE